MAITDSIVNFRRFLKRRNLSPHTIKNYINSLRHFVVWIDLPIEKVKSEDVMCYMDYLIDDKRLRPVTINAPSRTTWTSSGNRVDKKRGSDTATARPRAIRAARCSPSARKVKPQAPNPAKITNPTTAKMRVIMPLALPGTYEARRQWRPVPAPAVAPHGGSPGCPSPSD